MAKSEPEKAAAELFGRVLRGLREDRGFTAKDVSELIGLQTDTILKYERGEREPNILTLKKLSHIFAVSLHRLITGENARPGPTSYASTDQVNDIVVVRNSSGEVVYVAPDRRRGQEKFKGKNQNS